MSPNVLILIEQKYSIIDFVQKLQWNDRSDSRSFYITFLRWEYLGEFPVYLIILIQAKMGDNYEIWRGTGQLAS